MTDINLGEPCWDCRGTDINCDTCCGTGIEPDDCPTCDGTGAIRHPHWGSPSCPDDHTTCPDCNGRGH